jgi:putative membrane protein
MKTTLFRITSVSLLFALCLVPLYAHHGTSFLTKAMGANAAEVKMAEMATTKAQNSRVKEYGEMLAKDHTMALDRMQMLMDERKGNQNWHNMKMTPAQQKTYDMLSKMSGAAFDREFINTMVRNHRNGIRDFETHTRSHGGTATTQQDTARQKPADTKADLARDSDTIGFAREMLPTLRQHLQMAMDIQKEMKGGTPISSK